MILGDNFDQNELTRMELKKEVLEKLLNLLHNCHMQCHFFSLLFLLLKVVFKEYKRMGHKHIKDDESAYDYSS